MTRVISISTFLLGLLVLTASCSFSTFADRDREEFVTYTAERIDSNKFALHFFIKSRKDSSSIITDTVIGDLSKDLNIKYNWFDDSVYCIIPFKYPSTIFISPSKLKVVIHGQH